MHAEWTREMEHEEEAMSQLHEKKPLEFPKGVFADGKIGMR